MKLTDAEQRGSRPLAPLPRALREQAAAGLGSTLLEAVLFRLWELVSRWPCWQLLLAPSPSWEPPQPGMGCKRLCARQGPRREDACAVSRVWIKGEWFWVFFQRFQIKLMKMFIRVLFIFSLPTQANVWARAAGFSLLYFIWFQW